MQANLVVVQGKPEGLEIPLKSERFLIGRDRDCNLRPNSDLVSKHHCVFVKSEDALTVEDAGSTNGTLVNNVRIDGPATLKDGDLVKVGPLVFAVKLAVSQPATALRNKDTDLMQWLVADATAARSPISEPSSSDTVMDVPVVKSADETVADAPAPAPIEAAPVVAAAPPKKELPKKGSRAAVADKSDSSSAASAILAKYLDRRR